MVKKIERVGKTRLAASTSLFGLPSPPSRLGRNLSDCQRQISQNRTSGLRRRESVLAHTFRVTHDSGDRSQAGQHCRAAYHVPMFRTNPVVSCSPFRSEEHTSELQSL